MKLGFRYICLLAFIIVAYIMLPMMNADYLYTIQDNSIFISGHTFMMDIVHNEGGWIAWGACYLTQFFYYPWLGSTILILFWVAIYLLTIRLFELQSRWCILALLPPVLLLFNLLDYGYWIYYAKTPGFAFRPTLFVLFIALASCVSKELISLLKIKVLNTIITPLALCLLFTGVTCFMGSWKLDNHHSSILTTFTNRNFKHELRMYRALDEFRFEDVLKEMPTDKEQAPTNLMVLYKNIALMHTGRIKEMFKTNNCGINPNTEDSHPIHISQLGAPLIYYQFGQFNYAYRRAMENAVKYGNSFRNLKIMALCAIFSQDFDVAMKYITLLKTSTFHHQWAIEHEKWIQSSTDFIQSQDFQHLHQLANDDVNRLDNDEGLCEKFLLDHFSNLRHPASPLLEDVIMCLSLWRNDEFAFCVHFYDYVRQHSQTAIPELYQEGAILLGNAEDSPITIDNFHFSTIISEKFNRFVQDYNNLLQQGVSTKEMAQRLKPMYGDTYWWYYYFYTDNTLY